jgi:hypothetical protein
MSRWIFRTDAGGKYNLCKYPWSQISDLSFEGFREWLVKQSMKMIKGTSGRGAKASRTVNIFRISFCPDGSVELG